MELTIHSTEILRTALSSATGSTIYTVETPHGVSGYHTTNIQRTDSALNKTETVATIAWTPSGSDAHITVRGRDITPSGRRGLLSKSESFMASDGGVYKWKVTGLNNPPYLVDQTFSDTVAKHARSGGLLLLRKTRPGHLSIGKECLDIIDEVVATFVYIERKRQKRSDFRKS
jgi:hypothetical protein